MADAWTRLLPRLRDLNDLWSALSLMYWDQKVTMPKGGAEARSRSIATVETLAHERFTAPEIGDLLAELRATDSLDPDTKACVRILSRDYGRATKVPPDLVRAVAEQSGRTYHAWAEARPASDFSILQPDLERLVALKKQEADALGWAGERYNALLDLYEPGVSAAELESLFDELVSGVRPIAEAALDRAGDRPAFLSARYPLGMQDAMCRWLIEQIGFDLATGRVDVSPHPFTIDIAPGDVRQTIRFDERNLLTSVYASIHETGHALYEQGLPIRFKDLPVRRVPSYGMHESQSRLWENHVGRGRPFARFLLPHLKERFGDELGTVLPDDFYRGLNHPARTPIRVEADELTYNLHIALRFELELAQFRDELDVADLPDAWDAAMEKHIGIRPDNHAAGVLQDMHWPAGMHGYFPSYTLGTVYAAALFEKISDDVPGLDEDLRLGDASALLEWLRRNVYAEGYRHETKTLLANILGATPGVRPLLDHLGSKYSELYGFTAP